MEIRNKLESMEVIQKLNLNRFPEELFKKGEIEKIQSFIEKYPAKYYAVRDKSKSGGIFKLKVEKENIIEETKDYELFTINVSSANYAEYQQMVGEIMISKDNEVYFIMTTDQNASLRDAYKNPEINLRTDIFNDKALSEIPHFDYLYNFIVDNSLLNVVVEFALYSVPLGINRERIIVYELRTAY